MNELNFYRFVMFWLILGSVVLGIKQYGDFRVSQFAAKSSQLPPLTDIDRPQITQSNGPVAEQIAQNPRSLQTPVWSGYPGPINQPWHTGHPPLPQSVPLPPPVDYGYTTWSEPPTVPLPYQYATQSLAGSVTSWQPPNVQQPQPLPPMIAPPVSQQVETKSENPTIAEIMRIQQQLGGSQIETILAENGQLPDGLDSHQIMRHTLQELDALEQAKPVVSPHDSVQVDQAVNHPTVADSPITAQNNAAKGRVIEQLSSIERAAIQEHLMLFARELEARNPQKSQSCKRLARLLESNQNQ